MVHGAMTALLETSSTAQTRVMAVFDNEETGSGTKQGAASPVLAQLLRRIVGCLGGSEEDYLRSIDKSFMVSADNAHAFHPNYAEKYDPTNHPVLGGGPCIKINANCKYMTDAESAAVFRSICDKAGVPCQYFVNHSDVAGGSTLGNILTSQIDLRGVDMGEAIWAMHSVRETMAAKGDLYAHLCCCSQVRSMHCFLSMCPISAMIIHFRLTGWWLTEVLRSSHGNGCGISRCIREALTMRVWTTFCLWRYVCRCCLSGYRRLSWG